MSDDAAVPPPRPGLLDRVAALRPALLLSVASFVFLALSAPALLRDSDTADENMHLWAGWRHLAEGDYTPNPWHPPLAKLVQAIPMMLLGARAPEDPAAFSDVSPWSQGYAFLYRSGNSPAAVLWGPRVTGLLWGIAVLVCAYLLSRDLFGPTGALVTLVLTTACPTLLAHAHLATTDAPATALLLLTLIAFRSLIRAPGPLPSLGFGILLGLALCTKHNLMFLVPLFACLAAAAAFLRRRERGETPEPPRRLVRRAAPLAWIALVAAGIVGTIWAVYGFRYAPSPDPAVTLSWWFPTPGLGGTLVGFAREHHLLPEAYLYGVAFLRQYMEAGHPAYALGRYSQMGWVWYFPFAFLVKTPASTLALFAWGLRAASRSGRARVLLDRMIVMLPLVVYWALALRSTVDVGVRHLLPVLPLLAILAGSIAEGAGIGTALKGRVVVGLLAATLGGVASSAPHFLAYFNLPSTLVAERHAMLVDSNLDWGQDLGRLKAYLDRHGIASVKLAYFGNASPRALGLNHERLPGFNLYSRYEPEWKPAGELRPGDWVAVSATCYVGVLSSDKRYYLDRLGGLEPIARIGHSILLYRIPSPGESHAGP
ncbi:MAG TPA: glycosyltransferase family 39 protein [Planctomycetota bacterium]|nr:glycosyltransferase family 39 protein [Planctomycetota bacterium]